MTDMPKEIWCFPSGDGSHGCWETTLEDLDLDSQEVRQSVKYTRADQVPAQDDVREAVEYLNNYAWERGDHHIKTRAETLIRAASKPAVPREVVDALNKAERWLYVRDGSAYKSDADNNSAKRLREQILEAISILDMTCNSYDLSKLKLYISEARRNCWTKDKLESLLDQALSILTKENADGR